MRGNTLAGMLFLRLAPTILITIVVSGMLAFFSARHEINRNYDAQLINNVNILWVLAQEELQEADSFSPKEFSGQVSHSELAMNQDVGNYAEGRMFRIWRSGQIVMASDTALPKTVSPLPAGFSDVDFGRQRWRVYTLKVAGQPISIEVGERLRLRRNFEFHILSYLLWPLAIFVPLSGVLLWFGISNGLATIRLLVRQIRQRSPEDLSPLEADNLPCDLAPLGQSVNSLFEKLQHSLDAERRFADHAAHQLRTPLAGLKLQLQMFENADERERQGLIEDLVASTDRATSLVDKLLTAARVSHQPLQPRPVNIYNALASVIAGLGHVIAAKRIDAGLEGDESAVIETDETLLLILFANVLENAIKFTPVGGAIKASVRQASGDCHIEIEDTGPGIPENQREHVFRKFSRIDNSGEEGTGLGLAIVSEIVDRLKGSVALTTPAGGQGLLVSIKLSSAI